MTERTLEVPISLDGPENVAWKACRGDIDAFSFLVKECERTLYRVSRTVLGNDADCADAVQEALTKAWSKIRTLREPRYFRTWLVRILLNECYRILRHRRRAEPELPAEYAGFDAPGEDALDLRKALMSLPEDQRTAIVLFHVEDLTVDEIARATKVPPGTVKSRLSRARTRLAAAMRPKEDSK